MKIIIAISRHFKNKELIFSTVDRILDYMNLDNCKDLEIVHGGTIGVDSITNVYAKDRGYKVRVFLPDYEKYAAKYAPIARNVTMAKYADMLIAFRLGDSRGTLNMIKEAKNMDLKVFIIQLDYPYDV